MMKSHRTQAGILGLLLVLVIGGLCLVTCDEAPLEPKDDDPPEPKDYKVWFFDYGETKRLFVYHPLTRSVDTFLVSWETGARITASPDGQVLYVPLGNSIGVVDTETLDVIESIPFSVQTYYGKVAISPDSKYLAVLARDTAWVIDRHDYNILLAEPFVGFHGYFTRDSKTLYLSGIEVIKFTDLDGAIQKSSWSYPGKVVYQAVPTPDETKWLLYTNQYEFTCSFEVYDVGLDSVIFSDLQQPGDGQIALTPDGQSAFYGNPGLIIIGPTPPCSFVEFNVMQNRVDSTIGTIGFVDGVTPERMTVGEIAITPDGRWLVALDGGPSHQLLLYDLQKDSLIDYINFGSGVWLGNLSIQNLE